MAYERIEPRSRCAQLWKVPEQWLITIHFKKKAEEQDAQEIKRTTRTLEVAVEWSRGRCDDCA